MELGILDWIQNNLRCGLLDATMPVLTHLGDGGILWMVLAVILMILPKTRRVGHAMAFALAIEALCCNLILKPLVNRTRPFIANPSVELMVKMPLDASFPSGHAGSCFACAVALLKVKSKLGIWALIIAIIVAFSRMYLYLHYPTDVLAGLVLGTVTGLIGPSLEQAVFAWVEKRKAAKKA
jgi:undecaprenyl-diphosphatase